MQEEFKTLSKILATYTTSFLFLQHGKMLWTKILPSYLSKFVCDLKDRELLQLNSTIMSSVNAFVLAIGASFAIYKDQRFLSDLVFHQSAASIKYMLLFLGYILYDLGLMVFHRDQFKDLAAYFHHIILIILACTGWKSKLLHGTGRFYYFTFF